MQSGDKELIVISNGQCGIQLSNAVWELFCIEHGIAPDGSRLPTESTDEKFTTCFQVSNSGRYVPRAVYCDLEPTVVDEVRTGAYRDFFHPSNLLNAIDDGANNYARGNFSVGRPLAEQSMTCIRRLAETCDSLQGFFFINGYGGGTGSGFTNALVTSLTDGYGKTTKMQVGLFPGEHLSSAIVDPYNSVFAMRTCIDFMEICVQLDNESAYTVACKKLNFASPTYTNINRMIAQVISSLTCSLRYHSPLNADLQQIQTNTIPYPRLRFPTCSYAPFVNNSLVKHRTFRVSSITNEIFSNDHMLSSCDFYTGKFMAVYLQYRGLCSPKEINSAVQNLKRIGRLEFVDWCPTGFKMAVCGVPNVQVPSSQIAQTELSVCNVCNHSNGLSAAKRIGIKFDMLFSKRAFVHVYVCEGMEEGEFNEARSDLKDIVNDYETVAEYSNQNNKLDYDSDPEDAGGMSDGEPFHYQLQEEQDQEPVEDQELVQEVDDETPAYGAEDETPAYEAEDETPDYGAEDEAPAYGAEDETPAGESYVDQQYDSPNSRTGDEEEEKGASNYSYEA